MSQSVRHPIVEKAALSVALALGIPAPAVALSTGDNSQVGGHRIRLADDDRAPTTNLLITVNDPAVDLDPEGAKKSILAGLAKLKPISDIAATVPDEKLAATLVSHLRKAAENTSFNTHLLDWPGFNPEVAKRDSWQLRDYALDNVYSNSYGVEFGLNVPTDKNTDPKKLVAQVEANIKDRLPAIREVLSARSVKYIEANMRKDGKTQEEITAAVAKAREDMTKLIVSVNTEGYDNGIRVTLRSPEQAAAFEKKGPTDRYGSIAEPDNADALRASNPLNQLSSFISGKERDANAEASPQLNKAVARSFLFSGDKAMEIFPLVAGRHDIKNAIAKELIAASAKHPEQAPLLQEVLKSQLFMDHHNWHGKNAAPRAPEFFKDAAKSGVMQIWIELPADKVNGTINALAELAPSRAAVQPAAATPSSILAAHEQTLAATAASADASADMMSLATPESAAAASAAAAAPEHSSGIVNALKSILPSSWVGRTEQAPTSNSAQIG